MPGKLSSQDVKILMAMVALGLLLVFLFPNSPSSRRRAASKSLLDMVGSMSPDEIKKIKESASAEDIERYKKMASPEDIEKYKSMQ